jgi:hypothetical protein
LIAYCEEEKASLLKMIDDYLNEGEYQMAHFHQRALSRINRRLQTLKNISDKFYDEKRFKKDIIEDLENRLNSGDFEYAKDSLVTEVEKKRQELERLNEQSKETRISHAVPAFDEALTSLFDRKIKRFKLILKRSDNLLLNFSYQKKVLKVTLPYIKNHKKRFVLYNGNISSFNHLGFILTENENKLVLRLTGNSQDVLSNLKIILSKIVFEVFYFREFDNESYIEIHGKASR